MRPCQVQAPRSGLDETEAQTDASDMTFITEARPRSGSVYQKRVRLHHLGVIAGTPRAHSKVSGGL